ncbi:protein IQ-DOMAIN 32-like [Nymphaea colorata]|nr:protein IQ-DOMAIN 32-like [Nymphaea colorata]
MGRSSSLACLNIVACGKKSQDDDEIDAPVEGRIPSDKRRWSFRKRSATHRVLSNTVPPELPPSSIVKESPESNANDFSEQTNPPVLGKLSVARKADDVFPLSPVALSSKDGGSLDSIENVSNCESSALESAAVTIQASVMGYLAQRELAKLKNVIKLQAAVRGHLVRRQAVGTLRCVQAIIKMQALVRARRVRSSEEGLAIQYKLSEMRKTASRTADNLEKEEPGGKPNNLCTADTLFRSGFARRLLESAEKTKPICIVCDPTKPSSGWSWLERWMSLSAKEHPCSRTADLLSEHEELAKKINLVSDEVEASDKCIGTHGFDSSSIKDERPEEEAAYSSGTHLEGDDDLITIDANGFNFHTCHAVEMSNESIEATVSQEPPKVASEGSDFTSSLRNALQSTLDSLSNHSASPDCAASGSTPDASKNEGGSVRDSLNGPVSKEQDTEGKKPVSIPRKSCNPAFAAVQSKFEELSSPLPSGRISASSNHCGGSRLGSVSPPKSDVRPMDVNQTHDMDSCANRFQKGTSECGTEISISSTLDSPDRFELERGELGHEVGILDNGDSEEQGTPEGEPHPISDALPASNAVASLPGAPEDSLMSSVDPAIVTTNVDSSKHMEPDLKIELESQADKQVDDSSQEGSPTSRATILESHGTPSSQVSSGAQRSKADSKKSIRKRITSSTSKGSPSSQNHDSSEKDTLEHLPKESKGGRRRNSFGSAKSDNADREKGSTIPSYMQATESARAKALTSHSPKSSPDVHDKDGYLKKRHSLPGSNGKQQNSPRMQRSLSQAQPAAKVSSGHSPQEREWRR